MSYADQVTFVTAIPPFDELRSHELERVTQSLEIGFFPEGSVLLDADETAKTTKTFYMIIKGEVKAYDASQTLIRVYHAREGLGSGAIIGRNNTTRFVVTEDVVCYELPAKAFMRAYESNEKFKQFYLMDMVSRMQHLKERETSSDFSGFMTARVSESYMHEPCLVDAGTTVKEALARSVGMDSSSVVVQWGSQYGIVTDSDIKHAVVSGELDLDAPIETVAYFPICSIQKEDFLFNAYLTLIQKNFKRLAVMEGTLLVGMIEQVDILSYFANHSHLVTVKIEKATTIEALREASQDYLSVIKKLHAQGVKSRYIAKLVSEINRKVFVSLFGMILPENMQEDCALIIMGSEGRSEQIIRTDQDNALIVRSGVDAALYTPYMEQLTQTLITFGYPRCSGDIMVSNPYWCKSVDAYRKEIVRWIESPDHDSYLHFSIFFDALSVAGDSALLQALKEDVAVRMNRRNDIYMAHFAKLTTLFETPVGFFSTFLNRDRKIDVKKAGIFPIVQGVRSLCLRYGMQELSTVERIKALTAKSILEEQMAKELVEVFEVLSYLRLDHQLAELAQGNEPTNMIDTVKLSKIQRDLFKDSLQVVDAFKRFIVRHFGLENIS